MHYLHEKLKENLKKITTVTDITLANVNLDCGPGKFAENEMNFKMFNHLMNGELTFFFFLCTKHFQYLDIKSPLAGFGKTEQDRMRRGGRGFEVVGCPGMKNL